MEAKEAKRQTREEKRKIRVFRKQEEDKVSVKIAREEQKLMKAQRQLESIRLLDELFDRIKVRKMSCVSFCLSNLKKKTRVSSRKSDLHVFQIKVEKKEIIIGEKIEAGGKSSHKKTDKANNDQESHKSSEKDSDKKSDKKSKKLKKKKSKKEKKKKVC